MVADWSRVKSRVYAQHVSDTLVLDCPGFWGVKRFLDRSI